ncbi:MAG: leucine--tRNA ligase [Thermodesulfobacteriota bacterium]
MATQRAPERVERYDHQAIEKKWRKIWEETGAHRTDESPDKPKYYCLDMFPYPSGSGLHVGHWRGYVLSDAWSRYKKMQGYAVLHPMGWDAFGLPAENDAIKKGIHPEVSTARNIATFKRQLHDIAAMYDWSREINTSAPEYYKWTQWIFLKMFEKGLAYRKEMPINWCPSCKTGIANEEVVAGECERCGTRVTKKNLVQWMLRITAYADRLLEDLDKLDWPEKVKKMQADWIGRSYGSEITFDVEGTDDTITVFTTRADTLFGATYMVLAPEHPLVRKITTPEMREVVEDYIERTLAKSSVDRMTATKEKTGVFTGGYAINPINGRRIPIWIADYVLMDYGTGAVMGVPGHDERDFEFATAFGLPILRVIAPAEAARQDIKKAAAMPLDHAETEYGVMVNSGEFDGMTSEEGKKAVTEKLAKDGKARFTVNYKMRDWVFSRQRYWGEPIPIVHCEKCGEVGVPEDQLPVLLPRVERYEPTGTGESPLAAISEWVNTTCPKCGGPAKRETNTMPQWAGSCWYFIRYVDPRNDEQLCDPAKANTWLPVDLYVGGIEHAVLHLLYSRFYVKFLYDIGAIGFDEPFARLFNQGMIYKDGAKMSKSKGNVVSPDEMVERYGADSLRLYELFIGPPELDSEWNDSGIEGMYRFLNRVWHLVNSRARRGAGTATGTGTTVATGAAVRATTAAGARATGGTPAALERERHRAAMEVTQRLEAFKLNTAVSALMSYVNFLNDWVDENGPVDADSLETLVKLLAPFAPHIAEELWQRLGHNESVFTANWPEYDPAKVEEDLVTLPVQVNGKLRGTIQVHKDAPEEEVLAAAREAGTVARHIAGKQIVKEIYAPGKIVNIVVR